MRVIPLLCFLIVKCQTSEHLVLWQDGEERYQALVAVIGHQGSCQPECIETRTVVVPPNVFYKVRVEVAQVDMHSEDEQVSVKVGGQQVTCSPKVASDYNCSLVECSNINFGRVVQSELRIEVEASRTRDTCKCSVSDDGEVDCYSELLSGFDPKYGALVRLTFEPQVRAEWVVGDWEVCDQFECVAPGMYTNRSVRCRVFDPDDVGDGGQRCPQPAPPATMPCQDVPECQPPPACKGCFSIAHLNTGGLMGMNWSAVVMEPEDSLVQVAGAGTPLPLQLLRGLAKASCSATLRVLPEVLAQATACVSLAKCGGNYLVRQAGSAAGFSGFSDLVLSKDDGSPQFRMQATFHLRRVARAGYRLADPYHAGQESPVFTIALGLPTEITGAEQPGQSETCWLDPASLVLPEELCQASETHWTCPDSAMGGCCMPGHCSADVVMASCGGPALALVTAGTCTDVRCTPIEEREECEKAARALGLASSPAQLRLSKQIPGFCSWEYATADNGSPVLWLNKAGGDKDATEKHPQLCRCGEARPLRIYQWSVGEWSVCSRSCGMQHRYRHVTCQELIGIPEPEGEQTGEAVQVVDAVLCREAGLEEPASTEPCSTQSCWIAEQHTRCAGKTRMLDESEVVSGMWLVTNVNGTGPTYCVAMNATSVAGASSAVPERVGKEVSHEILDLTAASDLCRMMCSQLGSCVGFTFFDHVGGDRNVAQCCFLRRATRWQPNFRRASCHLARGLETRKGCFCQVGWEIAEGDSSALCRAQRRGCCTTPDNGARSWCPTTSPTCGTQLQNQLHWDACDPTGVAAVYEHTCRTHPQMKERNCASARGNSECNQIATVLGLPDTTPSLTLAMDMPSGCVWQKATSQLWLNQLVDAVNASDPSKKVAMSASEATAELCSCPPSVDFHWEAEEWRPCYGIVGAECHGARQRTRLVFCVQSDMDAESGRYQVVPSSLCSGQRPATVEACSGCDRMVLAAVAQFNLLQPVPGLEESAFAQSCLKNLALAAGLTEQDRMSVGKVECCNGAALEAEILVTDGDSGERSAADTVDQLMQISRSATYRSQVAWENGFGSLMQFFSLRIMGSYSWDISDSWGPCSQLCGGGFQSREVWCSWTGYESQTYQVGDMHCDAGSRPADQRACASRPCSSCAPFQVGPQYVVSGGDKEMSHENKVYVTCAAGYGTVDDVRLVESQCQDGEWTPLAVSCGKSCPAFVAASWKYEVHGSGNQHGSTRHVTCKRSETDQNSVEAPASASVICQDGSWTTPSLVCTGDCLTPELSSAYAVSQINGTSGDNIVQRGSVWHITCAPGFASSGKQPVKLECVEGSWSGLLDIPDCKADCPRYRLSEGYEVVGDADLHSIISFGQDTSSDSGGGGDRLRRMQLNVTGVVHGTSIGIRCVDGYGRVPGAVERLECFDGQWSSLSLFCAKDCKPFNATSLELSRFRVIMDMSRPNGEGEPSPSSGEPDAPHGSKIIIGCKLDEAADPGERAMKRGEVTCDNGRWIPSELRCFSDCEAFLPGPEYSVIIPGALAPQGNRSVPHGTQLLATCARGFSALPLLSPNASHEGWSSGTERRVTPNDLIVESECVDGIWTDLDLKCFADCPSWPLHQHLVVDSGGGLRAGSLLRLSCGQDTKTIRCGTHGIWELLLPADSDADSMKFQVGPPLNLENFTSICPHVSLDSRGAFMNLTFWAKLSDDERAMFMILALGCFGSLCGLACTYFLAPSAPESDEEEEPEVEAQEEDSANPGLRRFNLLTGELETSGQGNAGARRRKRRRGVAGRVAKVVEKGAGSLAKWLKDASPTATSCCNCQRPATHVCFPCSHLCLCLNCAEDLLRGTGPSGPARGFHAEGSEGASCPLCGQFAFCIIDAKPSKVFDVPGPLDMAMTAAAAAASSLRRTAATAAQGAAEVASRHAAVSPTMMGRARAEEARAQAQTHSTAENTGFAQRL